MKLVVSVALLFAVACIGCSSAKSVSAKAEDATSDDLDRFYKLVNRVLWDEYSEAEEDVDAESGRQYGGGFRQTALLRHGLLRRPMPQILRRQGAGNSMYRSFADQCYGILCALGLKNFVDDLSRMF